VIDRPRDDRQQSRKPADFQQINRPGSAMGQAPDPR
jgi:hypothetical protein